MDSTLLRKTLWTLTARYARKMVELSHSLCLCSDRGYDGGTKQTPLSSREGLHFHSISVHPLGLSPNLRTLATIWSISTLTLSSADPRSEFLFLPQFLRPSGGALSCSPSIPP